MSSLTGTLPPSADPFTPIQERRIILLLAAVQFVNILDFMMVMPLGPDFAVALGIPTTKLGIIGGSYTASAAVSGIICSFFLDRFDRRPALFLSMVGLFVGTIAGAFATNLPTLMMARILAGAFGGPATSLAMSIVADVFPPHRRGKAIANVAMSFSLASVLGVPVGLELARMFGWRAPFVGVAFIGLVIAFVGLKWLPSLRMHLEQRSIPTTWGDLFSRKLVWIALGASSVGMMSSFCLVPNFSTYFQYNMGFPRERLGLLYMIGGATSFAVMRVAGPMVDKLGAVVISAFATIVFVVLLLIQFVFGVPVPQWMFFVFFMSATSVRNVAMTSATARVPGPQERARFMSAQSAVQHMSASLGSFAATLMLTEAPSKALIGMDHVAMFAIALGVTLPFLLAWLTQPMAPATATATS